MKSAIVLLSGGLDSTVCAYMARKDIGKKGNLTCLSISYGQRHSQEIGCAGRTADILEANWKCIDIPLHQLVNSSLTGDSDIPVEGLSKEIPTTWVPQRNSIFLAMAFALAESSNAQLVYIGVNALDYSGYPDCRPAFIKSMEKSLHLGSKKFVETGEGIGLITPLLNMKKADIVRQGLKLGVEFEDTWSCYKGLDLACGVCDSCRIRLQAFKEARIKDPIKYEGDS